MNKQNMVSWVKFDIAFFMWPCPEVYYSNVPAAICDQARCLRLHLDKRFTWRSNTGLIRRQLNKWFGPLPRLLHSIHRHSTLYCFGELSKLQTSKKFNISSRIRRTLLCGKRLVTQGIKHQNGIRYCGRILQNCHERLTP